MLASANAEAMRPAEEIRGADLSPVPSRRLSAGWLTDWSDISAGEPVPHRTRAATFHGDHKRQPSYIRPVDGQYIPPVPNYAISSAEPIPIGFVAHARNGCVDFDHDWDSRDLQWGDGGELGEEWSRMHQRFRNGLQQMLSYYGDEDDDLKLVLVTHGAGCNALISAITSAPVLLDFGVASLTMAVRETGQDLDSSTWHRGSADLGMAGRWKMDIIASTEHLRGRANPLGLNSPRLGTSPAFASRRMVGPDSLEGFSLGDPLTGKPSPARLGRSASQYAAHSDYFPSSSGLWKTKVSQGGTGEECQPDPIDVACLRQTSGTVSGTRTARAYTGSAQTPVRASGQGLWGTEQYCEPPRRRWTLVDNP